MTEGSRLIWGVPVTRILGILLVPFIISAVFMWGLWDPPTRLNQVTAAVVNLDEPVTVDGQITPLGRVLAAEFIASETDENFDWQLTDAEHAADGLRDAKYVAAVVIPKNFSAAATSLSEGPATAEQAVIEILTSDRAKLLDPALVSAVTSVATSVINEQLGEAFVGNIFVGMRDLGEGVDQLDEGATKLAAGAGELAAGVGELSAGATELAAGAGQLADGSAALAAGAGEAADGATELADGVSEFAGGVSELNEGVGVFAEGVAGLALGANDLNSGIDELIEKSSPLVGGSADLADGVEAYVGGINQVLAPINEVVSDIEIEAGTINSAIDKAVAEEIITVDQATEIKAEIEPFVEQIVALPGILQEILDGGDHLISGSSEIAGGVDALFDGLGKYAEGVSEFAEGADDLSAGAYDIAAGVGILNEGAATLNEGTGAFAAGLGELAGGAGELAAGTGEFAGAFPFFADGVQQLADGSFELADGTGQLAAGVGELADGIPRYTDAEVERFAELAIKPVGSGDAEAQLFNGSGAPLFVTLALWAGALASFLLLAPLWRRSREAALSEAIITVKSVTPGVLLGILQGALTGIGVGLALKLNAADLLGFIIFTTVVAVTFALINQALVALLGGYGKFVSLIILTIGFVAGIISTAPGILRGIVSLTPFGAAESGIMTLLSSSAGGIAATLVVALWGALGFFLVGFAVHRRRTRADTRKF